MTEVLGWFAVYLLLGMTAAARTFDDSDVGWRDFVMMTLFWLPVIALYVVFTIGYLVDTFIIERFRKKGAATADDINE